MAIIRIARTSLTLGLTALALASCGWTANSPGTQTTASPPPGVSPSAEYGAAPSGDGGPVSGSIEISQYAYRPTPVAPGSTVIVTNADNVAHSVTIDGIGIDVTVPAAGQASFTAPTQAGSYDITCDFHRSMSGTLIVE